MLSKGDLARNEHGVRVRVQRVYCVGADVRLTNGAVLVKGTEVALVSLVGRPKLTTVAATSTLVRV